MPIVLIFIILCILLFVEVAYKVLLKTVLVYCGAKVFLNFYTACIVGASDGQFANARNDSIHYSELAVFVK